MYKSRFRKNWEIVLCWCSTKVIFKMFIFHKTSFLESSSLCCSRRERFHQREASTSSWRNHLIPTNDLQEFYFRFEKRGVFPLSPKLLWLSSFDYVMDQTTKHKKIHFQGWELDQITYLWGGCSKKKKKVCSNLLPIFHPDEPIVRPCKMRDMPRRESLSLWKFLRTLIYRKVQKRSSKKYCAKV